MSILTRPVTRISGFILALALLVFCPSLALAAEEPPEIRVLLNSSSTASQYTITVYSGSYDLVSAADRDEVLATAGEGETVTFTGPGAANGVNAGSSTLLAIPRDEDCLFRFNNITYRGSFKTMRNSGYYYAINTVDLEEYLYGVVGKELGYSYSSDATMAQAVAARSYAMGSISGSGAYFDVTATTSSQVYGGYSAESGHIRQAVDGTRGWVLKYKDRVIQAFFASSAGGYTENVENVWLSDEVPLRGVASEYDKYSGEYSSYGASCWSWTAEYTPAELVKRANSYGKTDIGAYKSITVSDTYQGQTSVSGRAMIVTIQGSKGKVSATKDNIRSLLNLKSTLITVTDANIDPVAAYVRGADNKLQAWSSLSDLFAWSGSSLIRANGAGSDHLYVRTANGVEKLVKNPPKADKIVIQGYGYGHGVGMSQWGAIAMGDRGWTWEEIIEHYYCSGGVELVQDYE